MTRELFAFNFAEEVVSSSLSTQPRYDPAIQQTVWANADGTIARSCSAHYWRTCINTADIWTYCTVGGSLGCNTQDVGEHDSCDYITDYTNWCD